MVYKKYIKRNGKLYGPYLYHSRRVNGKVISEYQGNGRKTDYKKFVFIFLGVILLSGLIYGIALSKTRMTGKVVMDLEEKVRPSITDLTIIPIQEDNESSRKYDLDLEVFYESNLTLNYDWKVDCGYFFENDENVGTKYSSLENTIEWHTTEECANAIIDVSITAEGDGQELVQSVFNPENKTIINLWAVLPTENVTETNVFEEEIIEENETEVDATDLDNSEVVEFVEEVIEIVIEEIIPLTEAEKQMLINEFGDANVESEVSLFNDKIIVRYEFGEMWIENSYDSDLFEEELKEQMEIDRLKWLRDILSGISEEEVVEEELEGFEESYSI